MITTKKILIVMILVLVTITPRMLADLDLRYLDGRYWLYLDPGEKMAFIRGFMLGSTSTEKAIITGNWSEAYSLYDIYDEELNSALTQLYRSDNGDYIMMPLVVSIYEIVQGARR